MRIHPLNKELVDQAKKLGFGVEPTRRHLRFIDAEGKAVATTSATPSDWRSPKNCLSELERAAGKKIERQKSGRSRKNVSMAGYIDTYTPETQEKWSVRIAHLLEEHKTLVLEFKVLGTHPVTNSDINRAAKVIRRISEIEDFLAELMQPVERFVPKNTTN